MMKCCQPPPQSPRRPGRDSVALPEPEPEPELDELDFSNLMEEEPEEISRMILSHLGLSDKGMLAKTSKGMNEAVKSNDSLQKKLKKVQDLQTELLPLHKSGFWGAYGERFGGKEGQALAMKIDTKLRNHFDDTYDDFSVNTRRPETGIRPGPHAILFGTLKICEEYLQKKIEEQ
jgi:hypothetical protein